MYFKMVKKSLLIFFSAIFLLTSLSFAKDFMDINIGLSKNDIVTETITIKMLANESYDSVKFTSILKPLTVIYDGEYSISEYADHYDIIFEKKIFSGENVFSFTFVYDNIVERAGKNKVFRTSFYPSKSEQTKISLTLPLHNILSDKQPSATPKPLSIESDGQKITLYWEFKDQENIDLAVFYKDQGQGSTILVLLMFLVLIFLSFCVYFYFNKKTKANLIEILSSEEKKIITELRKGVKKQKDIAKNLEFSKSKMSKVVRKLEEKGLIEKKPHFKTNILKLSRKIK